MSPEQASGDRDVDPRSDVYSLGCVLYEMLAGDPPFAAKTAQAVLARILTETPRRVTELRRTVPDHVASAIAKSLEKLPADRFTNVRGFLDALGREDFAYVSEENRHTGGRRTTADAGPGTSKTAVPILGAALALSAAFAAVGWLGRGGGDATRTAVVQRAEVSLPADFEWTFASSVRISPDDEHLLVVGTEGVWIRGSADADFRLLPETDQVTDARFSPDGLELVAVEGEAIVRLALDGSNRRLVLRDAGASHAPSWADDGYGYFLRDAELGPSIHRVEMSGAGEAEPIAPAAGFPAMYISVEPLPMGTSLLASAVDVSTDVYETRLVDFDTGVASPLLTDAGHATWVETGHIVFIDGRGDLRATAFDPSTGTEPGQTVQLDRRISVSGPGFGRVSVSRTGTLVYSEGDRWSVDAVLGGRTRLLDVSFAGDTIEFPSQRSLSTGPAWDPSGRYLAYAAGARFADLRLYVYDAQLGMLPRGIATGLTWAAFATWSPDGASVATFGGDNFASGGPRIAEAEGVGSSEIRRPDAVDQGLFVPAQWTDEGIVWLVVNAEPAGIYVQAGTSDAPELWLEGAIQAAQTAPQGDYIAYAELGAGITVRAFPDMGPPIHIADVVGQLKWAPDGGSIYYSPDSEGGQELRRAVVTREPTFAVVRDERVLLLGENGGWDLHPDGDRIVVASNVAEDPEDDPEPAGPSDFVTPDRTWIVVNWFERVRDAFGGERE